MKKIFLSLAFTAAIFSAKAQANDKNSSRELASYSSLKAKEDPHNPLVNGIPYSQYKNQVQEENKKKAEAETKAKAALKTEIDKMSAVNLPPIDETQKNSSAITTGSKK